MTTTSVDNGRQIAAEATMRAAVCERYGGPAVARVREVPVPQPGAGVLLLRVHASTVNRTDCGYRGASPFFIRLFSGLRRPKWPILGTEFAGEVVALGPGVTGFAVGDRLCGYDETDFGAHAEYKLVTSGGWLAHIPEGRSYEEAAPSFEGSHYALGMLRAARLSPGASVMVYGATGAIGSAAIQLAKGMGQQVTAVCPGAHVEMVRGLGADRVIDYETTDFTRDDERYDLVVDAVGKSSFRRCRRLLRPRGIYMSSDLGFLVQNPILALLAPLSRGRKVMFPIPRRSDDAVAYLRARVESGEFRPVLDRTYPLEQIADAYARAESGQKVGNIVITM